jgi:hypothetical protein
MNIFLSILIGMMASLIGLQPCAARNQRAASLPFFNQINTTDFQGSPVASFREKNFPPDVVQAIQSQVDLFSKRIKHLFSKMSKRSAATRLLLTPRGIIRAFKKEKYHNEIGIQEKNFMRTIASRMRFSESTTESLERIINLASKQSCCVKNSSSNIKVFLLALTQSKLSSLAPDFCSHPQTYFYFDFSDFSLLSDNSNQESAQIFFKSGWHNHTLLVIRITQLLI